MCVILIRRSPYEYGPACQAELLAEVARRRTDLISNPLSAAVRTSGVRTWSIKDVVATSLNLYRWLRAWTCAKAAEAAQNLA